MTEPQDGGLAFPGRRTEYVSQNDFWVDKQYPGMSLRDYFAAAAMLAVRGMAWPQDMSGTSIAEAAYRIADAMLKVRAQ